MRPFRAEANHKELTGWEERAMSVRLTEFR